MFSRTNIKVITVFFDRRAETFNEIKKRRKKINNRFKKSFQKIVCRVFEYFV